MKEFVKLEMDKEDYDNLPENIKSKMQLKAVDVRGFDYTIHPEWAEQKAKTSYKEYSKLKELEFKIRNG